MFTSLNEYEQHKIRWDDIRRQCEQIAAAREARHQRDFSPPFYAFLLAKAGEVLVDIGSRLQSRYNVDRMTQSVNAGTASFWHRQFEVD